jgi:hypothetical protein
MTQERYSNSSASNRFHGDVSPPKVVMRCEYSGCAIYDGEEYYEIDDMIICDDCAWKYAIEKLKQEAKRRTAGE